MRTLFAAFLLTLVATVAFAQHCPGIAESYLSSISLKHAGENIKLRCEYTKVGGKFMPKYQAYVLAYFERDEKKVPSIEPRELLDPDVVLVLHTQVIQRKDDGTFELEYAIDQNDLANKLIKHGKLTEPDRSKVEGWGMYKEHVRLAIFIPWLEDKRYATHPALPEERHECNYTRDAALLFQPLPHSLRLTFDEPTKTRVSIQGDRGTRKEKESE